MEGVIVASSLVVTMIYENSETSSGGGSGTGAEDDDAASKARDTCWNLTVPPPSKAFPVTSIPSALPSHSLSEQRQIALCALIAVRRDRRWRPGYLLVIGVIGVSVLENSVIHVNLGRTLLSPRLEYSPLPASFR